MRDDVRDNDIKLSSSRALIGATTAFWGGISAFVALTPAINTMTSLSATAKFILNTTPFVIPTLLQTPAGYIIGNKWYGISSAKILRIVSTFGSLGLLILPFSTELSDIEHQQDWRYILVFFLGLILGSGATLFQLMIHVAHCAKSQEQAAYYRALYSSIGGTAPSLFLLFFAFNNRIEINYAVYFFSSILTTILACYLLQPSPYHQLLTSHTPDDAETIAKEQCGQILLPNPQQDKLSISIKKALDRRCVVLMINVMSSAGIALFSNSNLFLILTEISDISIKDAVLITAGSGLWQTLIRALTGKIIAHYDMHSGGVYTYLAGSTLTVITTAILGFMRPFPPLKILLPIQTILSTGLGAAMSATFQLIPSWSEPKNREFNTYDASTMNGLVGSMGAFSSILFSLLIALFIKLHGNDGYFDSFIFTSFFVMIAMSLTFLMHHQLTVPTTGFFSCKTQTERAEIEEVEEIEMISNRNSAVV